MDPCEQAILVFAKAPVEGQVKTRLIPALGAAGAARLYRGLLHRLIQRLAQARLGRVELWCAPNTQHVDFQRLQGLEGVSLHTQQGVDLGERMANASTQALGRHRRVLLIGVDCPALSLSVLQQAFDWLQGVDAVLGPAEDGGYVLLGLKRPADCLFQGLPWGGSEVGRLTRRCMQQLEWRWRELPVLWDLDRPEDLARLSELGLEPAGISL